MMGASVPSASLNTIKNWRTNTTEGCAAIQRDLKREGRNLNKGKFKVLHLWRNNHTHQHRLGQTIWKAAFQKRAWMA